MRRDMLGVLWMRSGHIMCIALLVIPQELDAGMAKLKQGHDGCVKVNNGVMSYPVTSGMGFNGPWKTLRQTHAPILLPREGFVQYVAEEITGDEEGPWVEGRWMFVDLHPNLVRGGSIAMFKLRVNKVKGGEVQMIVLANLVLRIRNDGRNAEWAKWTGQNFVGLGNSVLKADSTWHQVTVLTSNNGFILKEDGEFVFETSVHLGQQVPQTFHVSKMSAATSLSIDLGDIVSISGSEKNSI